MDRESKKQITSIHDQGSQSVYFSVHDPRSTVHDAFRLLFAGKKVRDALGS